MSNSNSGLNPVPDFPGLLLVLSAPSGAGKTTLANRLRTEFPDAKVSISYTTRAARGLETDGVEYHFIDSVTFLKKIEAGDFIEYAEVYGNYYGTPKAFAEQAIRSRGTAIFDIDVKGGSNIKRMYPDAVLVFILPPSMEELERRLRERKTDSAETIARRLLAARTEMQQGTRDYDFIIVNDDIEHAFQQLKAIVISEGARRGRTLLPFQV
ncbi:MAG: guanylate kinase [Myxococcaceae bacterium]